MGISYDAYLGPYVVYKPTKRPTIKKHKSVRKCAKSHMGLTIDKFCSQCGLPIDKVIEYYDEEINIRELLFDKGLDKQLYPSYHDRLDAGIELFLPQIKMERTSSWDVKYNTHIENFRNLNVQAEIDLVQETCGEALNFLQELYGSPFEILWGLITSHN